MKKYHIDQDMEINTVFTQPRCMFYVDNLGNLLSNLKLSFHEAPIETGFFGKIFTDGNEKLVKDNLVKSYQILQEIYDDLLAPERIKQVRFNKELN